MSAFRYNGDEINARLAKTEAEILHDAIKDKVLNHEEVIRILSTRSKAQLLATFNRYRDEHSTSITKVHRHSIMSKFFITRKFSIISIIFCGCFRRSC